tara:strand:- start:1085 stop:1273 length:189 start_codon:yes stop_codon:yes gene_type:complete
MNRNVNKFTFSEVKEMTAVERFERFGVLSAESVMKSMLKEAKEEAFSGSEELIETKEFIKYG